jgi:hypothetical protein
MLYRETVSPELLELLIDLMSEEDLLGLRLVGGTALALQLGHRNSVDIDLFGIHYLDEQIINKLISTYDSARQLQGSKSMKFLLINGVKVDIVNYHYPWLKPVVEEDQIRMASLEDIAAMKVAAITQRGSKKDFIDLYFLLQRFSMKEIISFYLQKITDGNEWMALRSIAYFDDADQQPMPAMFQDISWEEIKAFIRHIAKENGGF